MPKIRKETSNRKSTNDRAKLRKKVKETKRKKARDAKKSVQWKSKTRKDPGIPSEFPYKDQILAEVAEQRRLAAEEKEKKKADKQRALAKARALAKGEPWESEDEEQGENEESSDELNPKDLNVGAESIASLSAKFLTTELKPRPRPAAEVEEEEEEEEEVPVLINRDLPNLKSVLEKADVVLEVVDGRDPLAFRSRHIEQLATEMNKKVLLVLNKIDTCPREAVASWSEHLRTQQPTLLFRAASSFLPEASVVLAQPLKKGKGKVKASTGDAIGADSILTCLSQWAKDKKDDEPLVVAVVGVTNVGKSALINSLLKRAALPVYTLESSSRGPTTTSLPQEVTLELAEHKLTLIDTPGLSFVSDKDADEAVAEQTRARDILLRNKGRIDRLKDANPPIAHIVSRANNEDLMLMYSLAAFTKGDPTAFLSGVARANQLLKKKGELDLTGAARIVLRDWSIGKLTHYTTPPPPTTSPSSTPTTTTTTNEASMAELCTTDEAILALLPTRKEKRKAGGLVRLAAGGLEDRAVAIEEAWAGLEDSEDEDGDENDDQGEGDVEGMDVDLEDEEEDEDEDEEDEEEQESDEEEEEEEEVAPPPPSNKQKRKRAVDAAPVPERPAKKVAFAAPSSKQQSRASKRTEKKNAGARAEEKEKSVPVAAPAAVVKSALKASSKSKSAVTKKPAALVPAPAVKKAANTASASSKKAKAAAAKGDAGPEAYDFGKFF